jgi:hypothetical protein
MWSQEPRRTMMWRLKLMTATKTDRTEHAAECVMNTSSFVKKQISKQPSKKMKKS